MAVPPGSAAMHAAAPWNALTTVSTTASVLKSTLSGGWPK